ncbi:MAG TPA: N-acetylmuramoyl-L-alanine amidase [Bradyrhizobium sp.]|uniref:N-acetylmuramoyl-L-alanine amidase family protein n=1 Tax=Bradyrhizobium sp. TaxID=376 RepID=UPI002BC73008|nr:N-acetylmuramoyl-L-alanine amidase [Bradyrhizobium sp.]HLZ02518.1 N-acetylmuramoyl-L-alanine amidase [Bradyrhizobium sp.]
MRSRVRTSRSISLGQWPRRGAIVAATISLTLLPVGASKAGWLSDLFKGSSKPEHKSRQKHTTAAKPAHHPKASSSSTSASVKSEEPAKPRTAEKPVAEKKAATGPRAAKCEPAKFHLIVDVGHTKKSDGAMSARNVPEFEFNLNLATRLVDKLKSEGFAWTRLMVTEGKARPSLARRVATANNSGADLFLSIHHDSVPDKFMENWEFDGKKLQYSDRFSGWSVFVSHENPDYDDSLAFARMIGKRMSALRLHFADQYSLPVIGVRYRHDLLDKDDGVYRYDQLIVLKDTRMPAVLLEAGSISNRDEELRMASTSRQDKIIGAVTSAVKEYCGPLPVAPAQEPQVSANQSAPDSSRIGGASQKQ